LRPCMLQACAPTSWLSAALLRFTWGPRIPCSQRPCRSMHRTQRQLMLGCQRRGAEWGHAEEPFLCLFTTWPQVSTCPCMIGRNPGQTRHPDKAVGGRGGAAASRQQQDAAVSAWVHVGSGHMPLALPCPAPQRSMQRWLCKQHDMGEQAEQAQPRTTPGPLAPPSGLHRACGGRLQHPFRSSYTTVSRRLREHWDHQFARHPTGANHYIDRAMLLRWTTALSGA
jgi:hypothetical protein